MGLIHMLFWITVWGIHHSLFARGWMGKWVSQVIPPALERSVYAFCSTILLDWMIYDKEINFGGGILWNIKPWTECNFFIRNSLALIGSSYFYGAIFQLGGLSLIGIPQAFEWNKKKTTDSTNVASPRLQHTDLVTSGIYGLVRHPLQTAMLVLFWITPFMTVQKFVWTVSFTIYIVIGINLEEKECVNMFGDEYRKYQNTTPQLIPFVNFCPFGNKGHKA